MSESVCRRARSAVIARTAAAGLVVCAALAGCTATSSPGVQAAGSTHQGTATSVAPRAPYVKLADAVLAHGGHVFVEADLAKAWLAGPARYRQVLDVVVAFANRPGVSGVKIADELGYGDGIDGARALQFLQQTTAALHARAPGRKVLADFVVPEFGCLAWEHATTNAGAAATATADPAAARILASERTCAQVQVGKNPGASLASVDTEILRGGLDVVDLSAGLQSDRQYVDWGTTRDVAMAAIWDEATRRWGGHVTLQARKALAHPGRYPGSAQTAEADVRTFVDIPLAHGAKAVDIWAWREPYKGTTYQLTDPNLADNALIAALRSRVAEGAHLWTHMSPSYLQRGVEPDVAAATPIFGTILVTSGTG